MKPSTPKLSVSELHTWPNNSTDLALLKLRHPVNLSSFGFPVHSICLPAPNIIPTEPEYGLTVGRGAIALNTSARVGYKKILNRSLMYSFGNGS